VSREEEGRDAEELSDEPMTREEAVSTGVCYLECSEEELCVARAQAHFLQAIALALGELVEQGKGLRRRAGSTE
jgi:hypothetical protein